MKTKTLSAHTSAERTEAISSAVQLLRDGEIVALPTETVYGLAADALNESAVIKIFAAKNRPRFDPLIVHLPDAARIDEVAIIDRSIRKQFERLSAKYWPGPLTFILPRRSIVPDVVTAGLETVAVRISSHPLFAVIVRDFGSPIAAPSANRFGRISPTTAAHVREELEGLIPLIIDGGPTEYGIESTIIALRNDRIEILRRGPITGEQLSAFGKIVVAAAGTRPEAPGQLSSHYAPRTPLILAEDPSLFAPPNEARCGLLSWKCAAAEQFLEVRRLSDREDLQEAATNLFRCLRELDSKDLDLIVAETLPEEGLGSAIMDRLRRASVRA